MLKLTQKQLEDKAKQVQDLQKEGTTVRRQIQNAEPTFIKGAQALMDVLKAEGLSDEDIDLGTKGLDENVELFRFVWSDDKVDRMGDTISADGWDLTNYRKNPVILWDHNPSLLPVGKAVSAYIAEGQLKGVVEFRESEFAQEVMQAYKDGFLSATSVGFQPVDFKMSEDSDRPWGVDFLKQELLEDSCVCVPAHPGALMEAEKSGLKAVAHSMREQMEDVLKQYELQAIKAFVAQHDIKPEAEVQEDLNKFISEGVSKAMREAFEREYLTPLNQLKTRLTGRLN